MKTIVRTTALAVLVAALLLTSCTPPEPDDEFTESPLTPVFSIAQLNYELDGFVGKKVWVSGYYGDNRISGRDYGYLVTDFDLLLVGARLPDHSCVLLDGGLPGHNLTGAEILFYGEVKDFADTYDLFVLEPTPLITVEEYHVSTQPVKPAGLAHSLSDPSSLTAASNGLADTTGASAQAARKPTAGDRALILSGGVDAKNNYDRYRANVIMTYNKLIELGFDHSQIDVIYANGGPLYISELEMILTASATKQNVQETLNKYKEEMKSGSTLLIFVNDHGTGYDPEAGYWGEYPALNAGQVSGAETYGESTMKVDLTSRVYREDRWTDSGVELSAELYETGVLKVWAKEGGTWVLKVTHDTTKGTRFISDKDLGIGASENDGWWSTTVAGWTTNKTRQFWPKEWDTDGDCTADVRASWNSTANRWILWRKVADTWRKIGESPVGSYIITGVDWNLDRAHNEQIGFHEGINLWGKEVLWDYELRALVEPLYDKCVCILVQMMTCFSGGFVNSLSNVVEIIVSLQREDKPSYCWRASDGTFYSAWHQAFAGNLTGIDVASWESAYHKANAADTKAWQDAGSDPKYANQPQIWKTDTPKECGPRELTIEVIGYGEVVGAGFYSPGTAVDVQAIPHEGNIFQFWSATAGSFGDEFAASTTFTIPEGICPPEDVVITARFMPEEEYEDRQFDHQDFCVIVEGEVGITIDTWDISGVANGTVLDFYFHALTFPDRWTIWYGGEIVFSSGWVSTEPVYWSADPLYAAEGVQSHWWHPNVAESDWYQFLDWYEESPNGGLYLAIITKEAGKDEIVIRSEGGEPGTYWLYMLCEQ